MSTGEMTTIPLNDDPTQPLNAGQTTSYQAAPVGIVWQGRVATLVNEKLAQRNGQCHHLYEGIKRSFFAFVIFGILSAVGCLIGKITQGRYIGALALADGAFSGLFGVLKYIDSRSQAKKLQALIAEFGTKYSGIQQTLSGEDQRKLFDLVGEKCKKEIETAETA